MPSLAAGGGEKALVNLLQLLSTESYEIDLLLFKKEGLFLNQVPGNINIIQPGGYYKDFTQPLLKSVKHLFLKGQFVLLYYRIAYFISLKVNKSAPIAEQKSWKYWAKSFQKLSSRYDVAISFLEKSSVYYLIDKVTAPKKIAWIHTQYDKSGLLQEFDRNYFIQLHALVTISEVCRNNLVQHFPEVKSVHCIENITAQSLLRQLASEPVNFKFHKCTIVTIGRLSEEKGIDMALEAAKILKEQGHEYLWLFIGDGPMKADITRKIEEWDLTAQVRLLGSMSNPYKYLSRATIYCQPSRYEGKSIALDEAKLLGKAIVVTDFDTVNDQIEHLGNGYIVSRNPQSIADGIIKLWQDENLRNRLENQLKDFKIDVEPIMQQVKDLIND